MSSPFVPTGSACSVSSQWRIIGKSEISHRILHKSTNRNIGWITIPIKTFIQKQQLLAFPVVEWQPDSFSSCYLTCSCPLLRFITLPPHFKWSCTPDPSKFPSPLQPSDTLILRFSYTYLLPILFSPFPFPFISSYNLDSKRLSNCWEFLLICNKLEQFCCSQLDILHTACTLTSPFCLFLWPSALPDVYS